MLSNGKLSLFKLVLNSENSQNLGIEVENVPFNYSNDKRKIYIKIENALKITKIITSTPSYNCPNIRSGDYILKLDNYSVLKNQNEKIIKHLNHPISNHFYHFCILRVLKDKTKSFNEGLSDAMYNLNKLTKHTEIKE